MSNIRGYKAGSLSLRFLAVVADQGGTMDVEKLYTTICTRQALAFCIFVNFLWLQVVVVHFDDYWNLHQGYITILNGVKE